MIVMTDPNDLELPTPDNLVVNISEQKDIIISLLDSLGKMFSDTQIKESNFIFALNVTLKQISSIGGRLFIF